jgi:hypothetical protein
MTTKRIKVDLGDVNWCELMGVPTSKFESQARFFAQENPKVMRLIAEICATLCDGNDRFLVKDVIAEIKFKTGGKLNNNIVTPISRMIGRLMRVREYKGAASFYLVPRESFYRNKTALSGARYIEFIGRYGPVANKFDEEARIMLACDQALYDTFITSCKDAVEYCKKHPPTWKISVKDIIHMTRLKYRIEDRTGRHHYVLFGNSMVTYIASMMVHDVPELKELANGPRKRRKKHDLDAEAELAVPEALIGALQ